MAEQDLLQSTLIEVGLAVSPLREVNSAARAQAFFIKLGYNFQAGAFGSSLSALATQAGEIVTSVRNLTTADNEGEIIAALGNLIIRITSTVEAIDDLATALQAGPPVPNLNKLPERLVDFLLLDYLNRRRPETHAVLHLLGLIEHEPNPAANQPIHAVNWERIGMVFTEPGRLADDVYAWNSAVDTDLLFQRMLIVMRVAALPGGIYPQSDASMAATGNAAQGQELRFPVLQTGFTPQTYGQLGVTFAPADAKAGKKKGVAVLPYIMGQANAAFSVCERGELSINLGANISGVGAIVRPPFDAAFVSNLTTSFDGSVTVREKPSHAQELILFGTEGGTRFSLKGLGARWYASNPKGKIDIGVEAEIAEIKLVIKGGDGDGFLQQVLSGINVEATAAIAAGFSLQQGFTFRGGAALAMDFPLHIELGPVKIEGLRLALAPADAEFRLDAGAVIKADLGPLQAVVENIGITARLSFAQGNLGPANLGVEFKPPNGVGLSIDAGVVKGGGYLFIDPDRGEYAGALELTFAEFLSLKAIGIITTKMPDGSDGFSLLVIITAEFGSTGLQLGYGFTLLGVGGLLGLNRTMMLDALVAGVRTGAVNNILFPQDIIANATRIISDLRTIFPPYEGKFLIGPMAKLGWGTPTLVSISLGVIIEIPGNIAILGVLKLALPVEDAPLVVIQVSFIGAIEFDKKRIYFFASLFESRVLFITIDGDMGLLMDYGDNPNFVFSVGGFNPRFTPPPLPFPVPTRISLSILNESWGRIRAEGYFAVTSNTVQFGARAEVYFGFDALSVDGSISFDALIRFSPFRFIVDFSAHFSVKVFGAGLYGVSVEMMLQGPAPWRAKGTGTVSLLFFDVSVDFDETWGESDSSQMEPIAAMETLRVEFEKTANWRAFLKDGKPDLVTLRTLDSSSESLVLHPAGVLRVLQKSVPLDLSITRIGNRKITDGKRFTLAVSPGGLGKAADVKENFAAAQFNDMSDQKRLASPAFEDENGGLDLAPDGAALFSATAIKRVNRYELITIDTQGRRVPLGIFALSDGLNKHFLKNNAVAQSALSQKNSLEKNPFTASVKTKGEGFTVAFSQDNKAFSQDASFESEAGARDFLAQQIKTDPALSNKIHILPNWELAA